MLRYVLKVKSSTNIPDFVQIRDENFVLIGYLRLDRELKGLEKHGLTSHQEAFRRFVSQLPFGEMAKFEVPGP